LDSLLKQLLLFSQTEPVFTLAIAGKYPTLFSAQEKAKIEKNACDHSIIQYWLSQFQNVGRLYPLHGSFDSCFENACGKCIQLGLSIQNNQLREKLDPFFDWFLTLPIETPKDKSLFSYTYYRNLLAFNLYRAGYTDQSILNTIKFRLDQVYEFTKQNRFDIFIDPEGFPKIPSSFQHHKLVDPALYSTGMTVIPNIHDIFVFRDFYKRHTDKEQEKKIDQIISYILHPSYQSLPHGYGIMFVPPRTYYSIGWDVLLNAKDPELYPALFLQRLVLMSEFEVVKSSKYYQQAMVHINNFLSEEGLYQLPKECLHEKTGYFVTGSHMGLGVNRRRKDWSKLESSFWMTQVQR
jgi:hypothetical protein